ncbi:MAG: hypothetical protein WBM24_15245, partial [Candidatus Sulfotelmatobacter sp.]
PVGWFCFVSLIGQFVTLTPRAPHLSSGTSRISSKDGPQRALSMAARYAGASAKFVRQWQAVAAAVAAFRRKLVCGQIQCDGGSYEFQAEISAHV